MVLGNPLERFSDEADETGCQIAFTAEIVEQLPRLRIGIKCVDGKIAPGRVLAPVISVGDRCAPSIGGYVTAQGGDLDWANPRSYVPEFSAALTKLKKGELTPEPVKSQFGYHIIRLEDRKQGAAQPFDQVKSAIRNVLLRKKVSETMEKIRSASKVEIVDEDLKKYAEDAAKAAKAFQEKQQKSLDQTGAGGDALIESTGGKGDLQIQQ